MTKFIVFANSIYPVSKIESIYLGGNKIYLMNENERYDDKEEFTKESLQIARFEELKKMLCGEQ